MNRAIGLNLVLIWSEAVVRTRSQKNVATRCGIVVA